MPATPAWPPKSAPRLFVEQELSADTPVRVEGNQAHYLSKVMRVAPGDAVILCDDMTDDGEIVPSLLISSVCHRSASLEISTVPPPSRRGRTPQPARRPWIAPGAFPRRR